MADWFYIGHYGQLGPLTPEQFEELIDSGVVARDTYVWATGMSDWRPCIQVPEWSAALARSRADSVPPPFTSAYAPPSQTQTKARTGTPSYASHPSSGFPATATGGFGTYPYSVPSPKSRVAAGILNIIFPGVGRIYLGYMAIGVIQLILGICTGVGFIWSIIDGIIMLTGNLTHDGYGRVLKN